MLVKKQKSEMKEMNATPPKLQVPCKCITLCVFCLVLRLALSIGRVNKVRLILFFVCFMLWQLLFLVYLVHVIQLLPVAIFNS